MKSEIALALLAALAATAALADAPYTRFLEAEDLDMQAGGFRPNKHDSYSGGAYALIYGHRDDLTNAVLTKTLERDLPPGRYRVLMRLYAEGEPESHQLEVLLNGARAVFAYPAKEAPKGSTTWLERELATERPGRELSVRYLKMGQRIIFDTLLVTNERTWRIRPPKEGALDHVSEDALPKPTDDRANLLVNPSFELGHRFGWHCAYQQGLALTPDMLQPGKGPAASTALRIPLAIQHRLRSAAGHKFQAILHSTAFAVAPGRKYVGTLKVKADTAASATLCFLFRGPTGDFRHAKPTALELKPADDWLRAEVETEAPQDAVFVLLQLSATSDAPSAVWAADAQVSLKDSPSQKPQAPPIAVAWSCQPHGHIFLAGDPVELDIVAHNPSATEVKPSLTWRVTDLLANEAASGQETLTLKPGERKAKGVALDSRLRGCFRATLNSAGGEDHLTFSIIERPAPGGPMGLYASLNPQCVALVRRLGFEWENTLSPAEYIASWGYVQPERDRWVWHDDTVSAAVQAGLKLIPTVHIYSHHIPKWALLKDEPQGEECVRLRGHAAGFLRVSDWATFVRALVSRYKARIKHWLIIDESHNLMSAEDYAKLLRAAYRAAKEADPTCLVAAHGGYHPDYLKTIVTQAGREHMDILYDYVRDAAKGEAQLGEGLTGFRFHGADRALLALWSSDGQSRGVALKPVAATAYDFMGRPLPLTDDGLALSPLPMYLQTTAAAVEPLEQQIRSAPRTQPLSVIFAVVKQENSPALLLKAHLPNNSRHSLSPQISFDRSSLYVLRSRRDPRLLVPDLRPGEERTVTFELAYMAADRFAHKPFDLILVGRGLFAHYKGEVKP